jgi:hypothetical protein
MTIQGSYQMLDALQRDMHLLQTNSPALSFLLGEKIKKFYQTNRMRLNILNGKRNEFLEKHCMLDANGKPMLKDGEQGKEYSWLSDEHKAEYEKEMLDLYQMNFEIYC